MFGHLNSVESRIKEYYSYTIYPCCMTHRIHLVVVDVCKTIKIILKQIKSYKIYIYTFIDIHLMCVILFCTMQNVFLMYLKQFMYIFSNHQEIKNYVNVKQFTIE